MTDYQIVFGPIDKQGRCSADQSLLDCARQTGAGMVSICGGRGTCHSCKVRLLEGSVSEPTLREREAFSSQELEKGWRLACQTYPADDCQLSIPADSMATRQRSQVEGLEISVRLEPAVQSYQVGLPVPSISDAQADADRLLRVLAHQCQLPSPRVDPRVLRGLSPRLRLWGWQCRASVRLGEVVAVGPRSSQCLGLAVDLGTTKIAGYLVDLSTGQTLAARGITNPQISSGGDIISRMHCVMRSSAEGVRLQELAVAAINQLAAELCAEADAEAEEIVDVVVVGNTAMHHLLLQLPVRQLAGSPFVPAVSQALDIKARDLGLDTAGGAYVHLLPNIAGFVGADHVAMLLAADVMQAEGVVLALDLGTNTEVSLIANGQITTVSCASGPAFEGGHIKDGVLATSGAIERLRLTTDGVQYQTIDDAPVTGVCGSGILDAMSQLYLAGVLDKNGRMLDGHPCVRGQGAQREFVLVAEGERNGRAAITITQQDVRELQMAKAAIRTGIQVLLEAADTAEEEIKQVIIAGALGSYIDVSSAVAIGMLPSLPVDRFRQVGNAAGIGAKTALVCQSKRAEAQAIASQVHYIELSRVPGFMNIFLQATYIGPYSAYKK